MLLWFYQVNVKFWAPGIPFRREGPYPLAGAARLHPDMIV